MLTAREHLTRADTYSHLRQLRRAARKRWPGIEWFVQVEFQRRGALHLNLLTKGVPVADVDRLYDLLVRVWTSRVDALGVRDRHQWAGLIEDAEGTVRYLSKMLAHGLKAEQAPPIGWRGHRTSQTRGYLVRPASLMRSEARESLRGKRVLWRAQRQAAERGGDVEALYEQRTKRLDLEWLEPADRDGLVEAPPLGSGLDGPRVKGRRPVPAQRVDTGGEPASGGPERDRPGDERT